ncbi:Uncharacterized protein OBRU01_22213 [Operophtera brumata]|uniref:Small ribosomal subunit protein mS29 n=1 Tax=Operophtera brumata TaxID=104452 RepID=A0A0L7KRT4_OPEBR|nr:Uncharacterized protein OBRU01_22213 [Operophtera brumata]
MLSRNWRQLCRRYSQATTFRTTESSPAQHNENQVGLFYTLKPDTCKQLFAHGGFPRSFTKQAKTFTETTIMGYLIVHVPWVSEWLRRVQRHKEMSNSTTREGFVDLPLDAAAWLLHFKTQNQELLKNPELKTSKEYTWSKREVTEVGAPLSVLVEHGITRVKYACDVIDALVYEMKALSDSKVCKTFVAIDGFNSFFYPLTRLNTPTKKTVTPEEVTLTTSFLELTKNDWNNGVVVVSADQLAVPEDHQESHLPKYLLYKKAQHNENQVGLFYTLKPDTCKQLFAYGGFPRSFTKQAKTFTETTIMGYLIVHVPWVSEWLRRVQRHKEMSNSTTREGFVDLPLDAAAWLLHFKTQNQELLKNPELKTSKEYTWSKREVTEVGAPLSVLVEHGITRVKYACDVIDALVYEMKALSDSKVCKTFVAIDGFNSFFYPLTRLNTPTKKTVTPEEVTLTTSFLELTKNDWNNGVVVVSADQLAVPEDHQESHLPKYLLYKKGFEHLDPFIPVEVGKYSEKEFLTCASYYRDRLWLRGPPELETELKFTSACNPYKFMEQCAPL